MAMSEIVSEGFPKRTDPLAALAAVLRLMRDKEATYEVFKIGAALDGPVTERLYQRFAATEVGRRVLSCKLELQTTLADRRHLASLPAGSLGRAYLDFVSGEGLSVEGFQAEMDRTGEDVSRVGEDRARFTYRSRHAHDLYHVLTRYGRDLVGELALLGFTQAQTGSRALLLIIVFAVFKGWREYPGLPVLACLMEGFRLGRAAGDFVAADWEGLLALPLEEARSRLRVGAPRRYLAIQADAEAIDRRYRAKLAGQRGLQTPEISADRPHVPMSG
jgi:ubiquinone biosynthesis protein COQ4